MIDLKKPLKLIGVFSVLLIVVGLLGCLALAVEWHYIHKVFLESVGHDNPKVLEQDSGRTLLDSMLERAAHVGEMFVAIHALVELCVLIFGLFAFMHERNQLSESLFQSAFFSQLALFTTYVDNLREGPLRGAHCLEEWTERMQDFDRGNHVFYWHRMSSYFLQINSLLQMIDLSDIPPEMKRHYAKILEAHFSDIDDKLHDALRSSNCGAEIRKFSEHIHALRVKFRNLPPSEAGSGALPNS